MPDTLAGREIVLAGGAGGLGSAAADMLVAEGARVIIGYRAHAERALAWQGRAQVVRADLISAADRCRLLDAAPAIYGLVVFAGDPARLDDPGEAMEHAFRINCAGPVLLARDAAERMKAAGTPGAMVLIGTMQAVALFPGSTAYAASKAALVHAARILAKECRGPVDIRVNVVSPGVMDAGMAQASIARRKYDHLLESRTIARFGRPGDVARAVRFFLEPDNYITGQVLSVDGGATL